MPAASLHRVPLARLVLEPARICGVRAMLGAAGAVSAWNRGNRSERTQNDSA
jgi:hypothetical protein